MDLIATYPVSPVSSTESGDGVADAPPEDEEDEAVVSVEVWRLNGQQVFAIRIEPEGFETTRIDVVGVEWRDNGQMIAILSSDHMVRLVSSYSGKIVQKFSSISAYRVPRTPKSSFKISQPSRPAKSIPIALTYSTLFAAPSTIRTQLHQANAENDTVLDDLLSLNADISNLLKSKADLPRELASIDVESFLPRLVCLPPAGVGGEDVFSTRNSIDAMFHTSRHDLKNGTIDLLCVGMGNGTVHLRIFDSFEVGDISLANAIGLPKGSMLGNVSHIATHPFATRLYVLVEASHKQKPPSSHVLRIEPKFIAQAPVALATLATKATQLQNLFRYLSHIQKSLAREIKTAFELPGRFVRPLNEDLVAQAGEGASLITASYHTIVTGEIESVFKEWLTEILGDRGVKRWEKAVGDCLELVRLLVSEGWLPAAERAGVVLSRLMGLAGCNIGGDDAASGLGVDKKVVEGLQATIDVMTVCGEDLLRVVGRELTGFGSFMRWLKWEVEAAGLEDTSERLDEMRENSEHGDVLSTLDYIERGPAGSQVKSYIGDLAAAKPFDDDGLPFYTTFRENRKRRGDQFQPPTFGQLLSRMQVQCEKMFEQIALALGHNVMSTYVAELPINSSQVCDIKLILQPEFGGPQIHVLSLSESKTTVSHLLINDSSHRRKSEDVRIRSEDLRLPDVVEIYDAKFVDEVTMMTLVRTTEHVNIYSHSLALSGGLNPSWQLRHTFRQGMTEGGLRPWKLEVNGRKGRRAVAVMDEKGKGYVVYDIDSVDTENGDATMSG